jgi:hypothetical protein
VTKSAKVDTYNIVNSRAKDINDFRPLIKGRAPLAGAVAKVLKVPNESGRRVRRRRIVAVEVTWGARCSFPSS